MKVLGILIVLIPAYMAAALFSEHVAMDFAKTDWLNLWTYTWIVISLPVLMALLAGSSFLAAWIISKF